MCKEVKNDCVCGDTSTCGDGCPCGVPSGSPDNVGGAVPDTEIQESQALISVLIATNSLGSIGCSHAPATAEDEKTLASWPGGGHRHVSHALLLEAIRHELFLCAAVQDSVEPEWLTVWGKSTPEIQAEMTEGLSKKVQELLMTVTAKLINEAAKEVLSMLLSQKVAR